MTGEPYAGNPPVRFGGRGGRENRSSLPLSTCYVFSLWSELKFPGSLARSGFPLVFIPRRHPVKGQPETADHGQEHHDHGPDHEALEAEAYDPPDDAEKQEEARPHAAVVKEAAEVEAADL